MYSSFNTVSIDLGALLQNYRYLSSVSAPAQFLAMIKADAYGHGMVRCAHALAEAGCECFGVAELQEAIRLRESGILGRIFTMLGCVSKDAAYIVEHDIVPLVHDAEALEALSRVAQRQKKDVEVHVKVNTGMNRLGLELEQIPDFLQRLYSLPGLKLGGIASHLPEADNPDSPSTKQCLDSFSHFSERLGNGNNRLVRHIANSGGTLYFPLSHNEMVRCGISLYGYYPEGRRGEGGVHLQPVMSFTTKVLQVRETEAGCRVSYGGTYTTTEKTKLAVLPIGYQGGFSRKLSGCGEVLIRGKKATVCGRVCMNLCMVDVTGIADVRPGDEVVVLGRQGDERIDADEIADMIDTISYEVLCMIGNNNQRVFVNETTAYPG